MNLELETAALEYHERAPSGKIHTGLSKPAASQADLVLAYSPGVAAPCLKIAENADDSFRYTGRGNLVGVISNGTAVLGLGNIGAAAAKPVMEGKAMLFKKFADIDVFDLEVAAADPDTFINAVKTLEPTFGGINLEDIKAPECFYIEEKLREQMSIPVFHDDQHGTAIIAAAAFLNALDITHRRIEDVKVVFSGAGAAAIATAQIFLELGVRRTNLILCDSQGVIYKGRQKGMNPYKERFASETKARTLAEALVGVDAFVGVSGANLLTPAMIAPMAKDPIIFALANPDPEILPDVAKAARPDAIVATGRSDFPNQVNNVLGFPYIFRGALDVRAKAINEEMKLAAVKAIAQLAREEVPDSVMRAYKASEAYQYGRDYLIPKPVDPRVMLRVAPAVAQAAMETGVARVKVDLADYRERLERIFGPVHRIISRARKQIVTSSHRRGHAPLVVIPHGIDRRIMRAATQVASDGDVRVCVLGRRKELNAAATRLGIVEFDKKVTIVDPLEDPRAEAFAEQLYELRKRRGVSRATAQQMVRTDNYFAAMMLRTGEADGLVNGLVEPYPEAVKPLLQVIGTEKEQTLAGIYMLVIKGKLYFFADCTINLDPSAETLAQIALTTSDIARRFTDEPIRVAMLSFSSFGSNRDEEAHKVAAATALLNEADPYLIVDGEMQADVALNAEMQRQEFPFCKLNGPANVLIFPDLASANISYKLLMSLADAAPTGPILVGMRQPANVMQRSATTEELINMIYMTAHQAMVWPLLQD